MIFDDLQFIEIINIFKILLVTQLFTKENNFDQNILFTEYFLQLNN